MLLEAYQNTEKITFYEIKKDGCQIKSIFF